MIAAGLKADLYAGKPKIGTFVKLANPTVIEALGMAGLDFAVIDTEHAPCDQMLLLDLIRAADSVSLPAIVRVPDGSESQILKVLDIGASGVQIPGLSTVNAVKKAVSYTKYAPQGRWGLSFAQRPASYGICDKKSYMEASNAGLINVVHIENKEMAAQVESLCELDGVDVLFIGPMDISQSLGHPGEPAHSEVAKAVDEVIRVCLAKGTPYGIFVGTPAAAQTYIDKGASYIALASDIAFLMSGYKNSVAQIRL